MGGLREHVAQAEHNERLYAHLATLTLTYADWQATSLFYAALHYVDAWLAGVAVPAGGLHPASHEPRRLAVNRLLRPLDDDYRRLESVSRQARYELRMPRNVDRLHAGEFTHIRSFIRTALALPL